jgi:hypothetical protein
MAFSCYRKGFFLQKKIKEGDRRARTEQTQYMKGREAEGTKIKTENMGERRRRLKNTRGEKERMMRNRTREGKRA